VIAASAAAEPAESGAGLGVSVGAGLSVGAEEVPEDVGEPPVLVGVGGAVLVGVLVGVGGAVLVGVLGGGAGDPVLGGGVDEPVPGDFAGGLDECCDGVTRAGRFSTLHCRSVAG
jgi:hypothetical protein